MPDTRRDLFSRLPIPYLLHHPRKILTRFAARWESCGAFDIAFRHPRLPRSPAPPSLLPRFTNILPSISLNYASIKEYNISFSDFCTTYLFTMFRNFLFFPAHLSRSKRRSKISRFQFIHWFSYSRKIDQKRKSAWSVVSRCSHSVKSDANCEESEGRIGGLNEA